MFFRKKTKNIINNKVGQDAIIAIDNLLSPIFYKSPEKLTLYEKNIVYIEELEREVNNDGFHGYFFNDSGNYTQETLDALKKIGSKIFLHIFEKAIQIFPNRIVPENRDERQDILNKLTENDEELWEELENEFFKYEEDIYVLMIEYIRNNIHEFR